MLLRYVHSLVILLLQSNNTYKDNIYIGFCNDIEKNNALLISDKIVYVDNVRCLFKKDISYLKYLKMLNDNFVYNDNAYYKTSSFEDIQTTYEFSKQINLEIPFDKKYIPKYNNSDNNYEYLKKLCILGLNKRFNGNEFIIFYNNSSFRS